VCISIPRQAGKTYLIACIIFALCLLKPGLTVIWTAHRKSTARETFDQFDGMTQRPRVAAHVRQVLRGKGDEQILFNNGSRILFGARESGFGRGFAGVDILVCDEGQLLPESTLEDLSATQNTAPNPLFFVMGTPPRPRDQGEFFRLLRQEALDGDSDSTLYIETSADPGTDPMDPDQLKKANPSYPHRTTLRALQRLRKKLKNDDSWDREARGIWDDLSKNFIFGPGAWGHCFVEGLKQPPVGAIGIAVAVDRSFSTIGAAGKLDDGRVAVNVADRREGVGWLVPEAKRIQDAHGVDVVIAGTGPAADLIPALEAAGVRLTIGKFGDGADAFAGIYDDVREKRLAHAGVAVLDAAVYGAQARMREDRRVIDRRNSEADTSPLEAVTWARWALMAATSDYDVLDSIL
jgi:hypothetical protein